MIEFFKHSFLYFSYYNSYSSSIHAKNIFLAMKFFVLLFLILASILIMLLITSSVNINEEITIPANYQKFCAQCHGADLRGGNAQSLINGVWQFGVSRNHMFRNIKYGLPHLGMPSYEGSLSDEEIYELVDFFLEAEKVAEVERPSIPDHLETMEYEIQVDVFANGLEIPWSIDFINEDLALITERPGRLRLVKDGQLLPEAVSGTPNVLHEGQGGLMDVAIDPNYDANGWIYLSYSHQLAQKKNEDRPPAMTRIVRGKLDGNKWIDQEVIFEADHHAYSTSRHHYGSRIVFDHEGMLYFSVGDRGAQDQAQDLSRPNGKIHRIYTDGRIPASNPFYRQKNALPTIFAYGTRNAQGLAVHPETGVLWETEHGPFGGDELNVIKPGANYGWPVITYGKNYNGTVITDQVRKEGMIQPSLYWTPSIAVCGLDFYRGDLFPKWENRLLVGALKYEEVRLLDLDNDRVMHEQVILKNAGRVRDVSTGPDGAIYVVLNSPDAVIRLTPIREKL
jgi:aldose sugar dehydrogenase